VTRYIDQRGREWDVQEDSNGWSAELVEGAYLRASCATLPPLLAAMGLSLPGRRVRLLTHGVLLTRHRGP
jgi:hypothetical protein